MAPHIQDSVQARSLSTREAFWAEQAAQLHWHKKPIKSLERTTKTLSNGTIHQRWAWFPGGEISTSYNCVDRHVAAGQGNRTAIIWDSPVTGSKAQYTYGQVLSEVQTLAGILREEGV